MRFKYRGKTKSGQWVQGALDAPDEVQARLALRGQLVRPTRLAAAERTLLTAIRASDFNTLLGFIVKPIDLKGLMLFTRQFSSLVDAGIAIVPCLQILYEQEPRKPFKKILATIKADIEGGSSLGVALARHRNVFSELYIRIVEAGEVSGTLDGSLRRIGAQLEKLNQLKSKVINALIYPILTMVIAVVVLIFLLVKVIPEIAKLYTESRAKLPELTLQVLALSHWVTANYMKIVVALGSSVVVVPALYHVPWVKRHADPLILKIPLIGSLIKKAAISRFARTFSTLTASGVPLLKSFEVCAGLSHNHAVRSLIQHAAQAITEGKTMAEGLSRGKLFPNMVIQMVRIGEGSGKLDDLLGKVADIFDEEVDDAVNRITGLLQPAMMVVIGGMVAVLLLAMYLPIFQLAEKVSGGM